MGRHSLGHEPELHPHPAAIAAVDPAPDDHAARPAHSARHAEVAQPARLSRAQERLAARTAIRRHNRRRFTAIPTACGVLAAAVYFADNRYHLLAHPAAASTGRAGASTLSGRAAPGYASSVVATREVSRAKRSTVPVIEGATARTLIGRPGLPKVDPYKTVAGTWVRPARGSMSSCFCMRWGSMHEGIDLAGPLGSPIVAVGAGLVLEAGPAEGFGHWIVIQQSNGDVTIYGHMFSVLVSPGQRVSTGEHIANIGDDGEATGPHLHFGVRKGGIKGPYVDPVPWLRARGVALGSYAPSA